MSFKFKETVYDDQESIDRIVGEHPDILVIAERDQIKFIKKVEFDDILPDYIAEQVNQATAHAAEVFFNEFPELEAKHFPFERPLFEANISPEGFIYEIKYNEAKLTINPGKRRGHYTYEVITLRHNHDELKKQALQKFDPLKDRFIAIIDKREGNIYRLMATDYKLDIFPLMDPSNDEQQSLKEMFYHACHEEAHYLTVPVLFNKFFDHDPEFNFKESASSKSLTYLSELIAYSMAPLLLDEFVDPSYDVDEFSRSSHPYVIKAREIISLSEGSLSRCNELLDEEIKKALNSI